MLARTARDLGAVVREARTRSGMTQADLATAIGVSRDWVGRLERGHPRLEVQLVLDALAAAGVAVQVTVGAERTPTTMFNDVLDNLVDRGQHG